MTTACTHSRILLCFKGLGVSRHTMLALGHSCTAAELGSRLCERDGSAATSLADIRPLDAYVVVLLVELEGMGDSARLHFADSAN